jgi:hypothetical protein
VLLPTNPLCLEPYIYRIEHDDVGSDVVVVVIEVVAAVVVLVIDLMK